jgi:hypothetical protein
MVGNVCEDIVSGVKGVLLCDDHIGLFLGQDSADCTSRHMKISPRLNGLASVVDRDMCHGYIFATEHIEMF